MFEVTVSSVFYNDISDDIVKCVTDDLGFSD